VASKAIDKDKLTRQSLKERTTRARETVKTEREALRQKVDEIRQNCGEVPSTVFARLRERFLTVGRKLEANLDPDAQLFDDRFKTRVERTAKAGCRLKEREARVEAEPAIRAGKVAYKGHRNTQKEEQKVRRQARERAKEQKGKNPTAKIAKGSRNEKRKEAEDAVIHELMADAQGTGPMLVPIWEQVKNEMFKKANRSRGKLSPFEAFAHWVGEHEEEVNAMLDRLAAGVSDADLAREQAAYMQQNAPPASGPRPSTRAPASGPRPSRRAPAHDADPPHTVHSRRSA
jgi:hypothetical protein